MAHDPVRLDRIAGEEVEGGGADQRHVDHQARPRPGDDVGLDQVASCTAIVEQKSRSAHAPARSDDPPDRPAGHEIDDGNADQERVEQRLGGGAHVSARNRRQGDTDLLAVTFLEQVGVGHASAQPMIPLALLQEVRDAVDLQDPVAGARAAADRRRRERLDHGPAAEP